MCISNFAQGACTSWAMLSGLQRAVSGVQEDKENFCNSVRTEVKATGMMDTPDNCWDFFRDKVCLYWDLVSPA